MSQKSLLSMKDMLEWLSKKKKRSNAQKSKTKNTCEWSRSREKKKTASSCLWSLSRAVRFSFPFFFSFFSLPAFSFYFFCVCFQKLTFRARGCYCCLQHANSSKKWLKQKKKKTVNKIKKRKRNCAGVSRRMKEQTEKASSFRLMNVVVFSTTAS